MVAVVSPARIVTVPDSAGRIGPSRGSPTDGIGNCCICLEVADCVTVRTPSVPDSAPSVVFAIDTVAGDPTLIGIGAAANL